MTKLIPVCALLAAILSAAGCQKQMSFPEISMAPVAKAYGARGAYDTNGDGLADFFTFAGDGGRVTKIAYDEAGAGRPGPMIDLDAIPFEKCRHLVLFLDGFGYEVLREYHESGGLALFHAPSRVIAPYPAMTDTALDDALGLGACPGNEALYFDRRRNEMVGGSAAYLRGENMPYNRVLSYRAGLLDDALGYLWPRGIYTNELAALKKLFDQNKSKEVVAYFVSSAGIGTKFGKEGQLQALRQLDRLLNQILCESRGMVKFTLSADHGHSYTPSTRIPLEKALQDKGWTIKERLDEPKDVVYIRFGLETYAAFYTQSPDVLAEDLARTEGVELASYAAGTKVAVLARRKAEGTREAEVSFALVGRKGDRYSYERRLGDPLRFADVLAKLAPDAEGYYDANEMLAASVTAYYPAALERIWRAHFGLVLNPPDVIVSLEDRFYSGSTAFAGAVNVASTHGGLNRSNCTAFIMSTAGGLPPFMRSADVPGNMARLTGTKWPLER